MLVRMTASPKRRVAGVSNGGLYSQMPLRVYGDCDRLGTQSCQRLHNLRLGQFLLMHVIVGLCDMRDGGEGPEILGR